MKPNDLAYYLTAFLTKYLPGEIGARDNTISSYRDTFMLFLKFMRDQKNIAVERLTLIRIKKHQPEAAVCPQEM